MVICQTVRDLCRSIGEIASPIYGTTDLSRESVTPNSVEDGFSSDLAYPNATSVKLGSDLSESVTARVPRSDLNSLNKEA
jgi:hypothetical protein